ncbi:MAG TPA: hypothetical protein PK020_02480 [Ilumatobacteraceae bacterium]|nr:hypothetical protein [Ilumatobacteraceae bacterium]HRB02714.1 hypothetical protein [Ilumatobacteraceae bacterium]
MTRKLVLSATLATAAVLLIAGTTLAEGPGRGMDRDRSGRPLFAILVMVVVAAAAIFGTWRVIRRGSTPAVVAAPVAAVASPTGSAEAILAERLARSEISPDDYRSMLAALRGAPSAPRVEGDMP